MGRKMRELAALLVILGMIYWQQPSVMEPAYAKEKGIEFMRSEGGGISAASKSRSGKDEAGKNPGKDKDEPSKNSSKDGNKVGKSLGEDKNSSDREEDRSPSEGSGEDKNLGGDKDNTDKEPGDGSGEDKNPGEGEDKNLGEGEDKNPGEGEDKNPGEGEDKNPGGDKDDTDKDPGDGEDKSPGDGEGEDKNPGDGEGEDKDSGGDKDDTDKDPGDGSGEGEKEEIKEFEVSIPPQDGQNGYYVTRPELKVRHVSSRGTTRYCFTDGSSHKKEGELSTNGDELRVEKNWFREGRNHLSIWMEDEEGQRQEEYVLEKTFLIDTSAPSVRVQAPMGTDAWYQKEVFITVLGEDGERGSQIEEVSCFLGSRLIGSSRKSPAGFLISFASAEGKAVPVKARVRDRAGNTSEETWGFYIDQNPPRTSIEGIEDYMITSRPVEVAYRIEEENIIGEKQAGARREDPEGQVEFLEAGEWKEDAGGYSARQTLSEDGIYHLSVSACDQAGYESSGRGQVIIDSENPVIRHVDEVDGQYLKSFCWEYPAEEAVQDFTSYTYSVYLDGKPYHIGENVLREGKHVLEVKAEDAAGNMGRAEADFSIDRTAPQILFGNVKEGETYEPEKELEVSLADQEDYIEEIRINGEVQKVGGRKKYYSYSMKECGNYEIVVKACDRAGNRAVSRMDFTIARRKGLLHKFSGPLRKMLGEPVRTGTEASVKQAESRSEEIPRYGLWKIILGMTGAGCIAAVVYQRKRSEKRLKK